MNLLILKIAAVPCAEAGRAIYQLGDLSDDGVSKAMMHLQHQKNGTERLPLNQYQIVAISAVSIEDDSVGVQILGDEQSTEAELLVQLAELLELVPDLVSWNGDEFDLPIIGYRLLKYGIACPAFWKRDSLQEDSIQSLDLMYELSGYSDTAMPSLSDMAKILGLSGEMGLQSIDVLAQYQANNLTIIRQACEVDALNTYLIYLKFLRTSGDLSEADYNALNSQLRRQMVASTLTHLRQFAAVSWVE
ncbi:MAG: 3'-5' exonuclease [Proteobacteria bacterium]|nr:MAG: 3'-5' exonuclease [Pseudomonadota bacterium]